MKVEYKEEATDPSGFVILQRMMVRNGFSPFPCEWWHFTLTNEPYPDTYFKFPVTSSLF